MNTNKNNKVTLIGTIISELTFDHEVFGEKFYMAYLTTERKSGTADVLPLLISERIIDTTTTDYIGCRVKVNGHFRSYNRQEEDKKHLILSVLVEDIESAGEQQDDSEIVLEGFLCKKPTYRKTPLGREITDCLVAVNRAYGKSDYIPRIVWGRNAGYMSQFDVGTKFRLEGRIQSRAYQKKLSETEFEDRTAYEVSVSRFELLEAK